VIVPSKLRRGEEPKDVFGRLGYEPTTVELEAVFKRSNEGEGDATP